MSMSVTRDIATFGRYEFACGGEIPRLDVAYETYGEYDGDNAVLLCQPLTTSQHAARPYPDTDTPPVVDAAEPTEPWWDEVVGPGKPIDTETYYVICANLPGSCYGTSGPTSTNPETDEPYGPDFPATRVEDWTDTQRRLLEYLEVDTLHAVVGGSVGGVNVLDWVRRYPDELERAVPIAATPRVRAQALAFDALARRAITTDPHWNGGRYYDGPSPDHGLMLARQLGLIRYLSSASFDEKFGTNPADGDQTSPFPPEPSSSEATYRAVESFLDYQGEQFTERFDANSYISLTRALDEFDLADGYPSDAAALAGFDGEAFLVSFSGDWYYPVERSTALETAFRDASVSVVHCTFESDYGHDAFLAHPELFEDDLQAFLADGITGISDSRFHGEPLTTEVN
jgi:homoserine O-acetyltransferase